MKMLFCNIKREITIASLVASVCIIALCIAEFMISKDTVITHNIEFWIDGSNTLDFFFPIFVSLPFAWRLYFERKDGFLDYISIRTDKRKYIIQKIIAGMTTVFVMVFVIYYVGLVVAELFIEPQSIASDDILLRYVWGDMQAENPLMFGIFWCMWKGFIGALICAFGYGIALLSDNVFVISLLPFLFCTMENFVTGTLGIERFSIYTAFILNRLSPTAMKIYNYFTGVISFVVIGGLIILIWYFRKKWVTSNEKFN